MDRQADCVKRASDLPQTDDWDPPRTGDWATDNAIGRMYAATVLNLMVTAQNPMPFVRLMRAMIHKGMASGVEIGFLHALAQKLMFCLPLFAVC